MSCVSVLVFGVLFVAGAQARKLPLDSRIVGGQATTIQDHPHQVSVIYIDSHYCGGTIINSYHILTAAHCTNNVAAQDLFVRAGSTMVNEGGQIRQVEKYFQHGNFDSDTYDYDISVLRLSEGLNFGDGVAAITLPEQNVNDVAGGILCTATGWGRLSQNGPLPLELQEVDLPTIEPSVCEMVYGSSMTKRMLCAGYVVGNKDTCQGDSGGPFVHDGVLIGVTSWGDGCGAAQSPGVYVKVQYFRDYIDGIINS